MGHTKGTQLMPKYLFFFGFVLTFFSAAVNDYKTNWIGIAKAGVISGQVLNMIDDEPIVGASVKVLQNGKMKASAITDSDGYFSIPGLKAENYNVIAETKKFGSMTIESVPVSKGTEVTTHFILTPTYSIQ